MKGSWKLREKSLFWPEKVYEPYGQIKLRKRKFISATLFSRLFRPVPPPLGPVRPLVPLPHPPHPTRSIRFFFWASGPSCSKSGQLAIRRIKCIGTETCYLPDRVTHLLPSECGLISWFLLLLSAGYEIICSDTGGQCCFTQC